MLFNLFKKNDKPDIKDLVWIHSSAKTEGCKELLRKYPNAVVAGWFNETISKFQQAIAAEFSSVSIHNVRQLPSALVANKLVILLEHYPINKKEEEYMQNWKASSVYVLNALDEPLFIYFGGERITGLMQKMGMKENESIEHGLITASLKNAQQKITDKVVAEHSAQSQEEWFRHNLPAKNQ